MTRNVVLAAVLAGAGALAVGCPAGSVVTIQTGGASGSTTRMVNGSHYEERREGSGAASIALVADRVEDGVWRLTRFERAGRAATPTAAELDHLSLSLDAAIETDAGSRREHPLRAVFRDVAAGKAKADWRALLPRIMSKECDVPGARGRFVNALAGDPGLDREGALAVLKAACDPSVHGADATVEKLLGRPDATDEMRSAAIDAVSLQSFDDSKKRILVAVLATRSADDATAVEAVDATATFSFDDAKKAVLLAALAGRGEVVRAAVADATGRMSFDSARADVLCAVVGAGPVSAALSARVEGAARKLSFPSERERVLTALLHRKQ